MPQIKYLRPAALATFFKAVDANPDGGERIRDRAVFRLMLALGLRAAEVGLLKMRDVDMADPSRPRIYVTRVKEKHWRKDRATGERRYVRRERRGDWYTLDPQGAAIVAIKAWLKERAARPKAGKRWLLARESDALFLTRHSAGISASYLRHIVMAYGRAAGMKVSSHAFRHTAGVRCAMKGLNSFEIAQRLGHVSSLSTEHYVKTYGPERERQDDRANRAIEGNGDDSL